MSSINSPYSYTPSLSSGAASCSSLPRQQKSSAPAPERLTFIVASAMITVSAIGLCLASYLSWVAFTSSKVAGCGGGQIFDCSHVLQSKWSTAFGVPVGAFAAVLYLAIIAAIVVAVSSSNQTVQRHSMRVVGVGALSAGLAAIWFISLQVFVVERLCGYCLAAHCCGLILAAGAFWLLPLERSRIFSCSAVALAGVSILAMAQVTADSPETFQVENFSVDQVAPNAGSSGTGSSTDESNVFSAPGFEAEADTPAANNFPSNDSSNTLSESPGDVSEKPDQIKGNQTLRISSPATYLISFSNLISPGVAMIAPGKPLTIQQVRRQPVTTTGYTKKVTQDSEAKTKKPEERRLISISSGTARLDVRQWPLIGNEKAKTVFVEMFDYTCPHCRANHSTVKAAKKQLGNDVAILVLCVPIHSKCNPAITSNSPKHADACELARLSVAVWRVDASKFAKFHDWLFEGVTAPSAAAARAYASKLVDKQKLDAELADKIAGQYVAQQVKLYQKIGAGAVPKLLFPGTTVTGTVGSKESLIQIIRQQSGK